MARKVFSGMASGLVRDVLLLVSVVCIMTTTASAGFEWIPSQKKKEPAPSAESVQSENPSVPSSGSDNVLLPEASALVAPAVPVPSVPPPAHLSAPVGLPLPLEDTPVIKTLQAMPRNPIVQNKGLSAAPADESAEPSSRIIMSQDAPAQARNNFTGKDRVVVIDPQPMKNKSPVQAPEQSDFAVIDSFGSDMPLALALQEIVPTGYAYSFGVSVDAGRRVSWKGGKSWFAVIQDLVAPMGLVVDVKDHLVYITHPSSQRAEALSTTSPRLKGQPAQNEVNLYQMRRQAIQDPGEAIATQPVETVQRIERIAAQEQAGKSASIPAQQVPRAPKMLLPEDMASPADVPALPVAPYTGRDNAGGDDASNARPIGIWEIQKGASLKRTLQDWGKKASYVLVWEPAHDYAVAADFSMKGDIRQAIKMLFAGGLSDENPPRFVFQPSPRKGVPDKVVVKKAVPTP